TSRIQANLFRTCATRLSLMAVSSCWRMAAHLFLDPPAGQMADPVEPLLLEDQMADDHRRGPPVPQLAGQLPEGEVGLPVEALVGLVEEQYRRVVHEGEGQAEFLPGPAREGAGPLAAAGGIAQPLDQLPGPAGAAEPVCGLEIAHVLVHGECLIEDDRLRAVARPAADGHAARVRAQVTGEDPQQRRLPRPVLPYHRNHLPGRDLKVKAGQHLPSAERFADSPRCQRNHGLRPFPVEPDTASLVRRSPPSQGAAWRVTGVPSTSRTVRGNGP